MKEKEIDNGTSKTDVIIKLLDNVNGKRCLKWTKCSGVLAAYVALNYISINAVSGY